MPSVIRGIDAEVQSDIASEERRARIAAERERLEASVPASQAKIDVSTIGRTPEELEGMRNAKRVDEVLDAIDKEKADKMQSDYDRYAEAFTKADAALRRYRSELHNIITLKGKNLDQLREYRSPLTGFNAIENDVAIVSEQWLSELQAVCELLTTRRGPTEFNFERSQSGRRRPRHLIPRRLWPAPFT